VNKSEKKKKICPSRALPSLPLSQMEPPGRRNDELACPQASSVAKW